MAGWIDGGNMGNIPDVRPDNARRKWAWRPITSTESGEPIWLTPYWQVKTYEIVGPSTGSWGQAYKISVWRLTEDEYLLYALSKSMVVQ